MRQLITVGGGACWYSAHTAAGGGSTELIFAPPLRLINGATAPIAFRADEAGGEAEAAAAVEEVGAGQSVALLRRPRSGLLLSLRPAAHAWCEPPLLLDAAALQRAAESPLVWPVRTARGDAQPIQLQLHLEPSAAADGAGVCAALIAPFEARNCSSQALLVQSSVAHAHTIALPAADAAGAGFALGSWGGANEQSRPKFLLRFAAHPPDDAPVEWCDWLPVGREAPLALPRGDDEIVLLQLHATARRTAGCAHWHLELRAALTLHNTSARPLRAVVCGLPFFHSLPAGGSAPVEVWGVAARAQPLMRVQVCAADDAADDDAWGWSGELDVGEAAAGKRQRAVLQSERGRLLLVSAEVSADGSGAFCATFFDDPQPPIVLRNHTAADIYFAPELDDEGEEEGEEEWLRLAAGATAHFALPVDDDALLPGAEAAAAGEGEAARSAWRCVPTAAAAAAAASASRRLDCSS